MRAAGAEANQEIRRVFNYTALRLSNSVEYFDQRFGRLADRLIVEAQTCKSG